MSSRPMPQATVHGSDWRVLPAKNGVGSFAAATSHDKNEQCQNQSQPYGPGGGGGLILFNSACAAAAAVCN